MALSHAIIQIPVPLLTRESLSGILIVLGLRENLAGFHQIRTLGAVLSFASLAQASCGRARQSEGERLARTYCTACHAFPDPQLLDKKTWQEGVLPQMALRVGAGTPSLYDVTSRNPYMAVLTKPVSAQEWEKIVGYYRERAPDSLPYQSLPAEPQL